MKHYLAVHVHDYGQTIATFTADDDFVDVFARLPETDKDCTHPEWELTQVDCARELGLTYEPERDSITFHEVNPNNWGFVNLADYRDQK